MEVGGMETLDNRAWRRDQLVFEVLKWSIAGLAGKKIFLKNFFVS